MWWQKIFGIWLRKWAFSFIRAASLHLVLTLFNEWAGFGNARLALAHIAQATPTASYL